jgi:hypothetical protein
MKQGHEVAKFKQEMIIAFGTAVLMGVTGGLAGPGVAAWAVATRVATGAAAAGAGVYQLAGETKDLLNRRAVSAAATNPEGELLGVSAPSRFEYVMNAVGWALAFADLAGVIREIRELRPHFAETPHSRKLEGELVEGERFGTVVGEADPETMADAAEAVKYVDEHPDVIKKPEDPGGPLHAQVNSEHEIVEVPNLDGVGFHCEYHSPGSLTVVCPIEIKRLRAGLRFPAGKNRVITKTPDGYLYEFDPDKILMDWTTKSGKERKALKKLLDDLPETILPAARKEEIRQNLFKIMYSEQGSANLQLWMHEGSRVQLTPDMVRQQKNFLRQQPEFSWRSEYEITRLAHSRAFDEQLATRLGVSVDDVNVYIEGMDLKRHHETPLSMYLVPAGIHDIVPHTGPFAEFKEPLLRMQ